MPEFCGTCKAPVLWTLTPSGAKSPIDPEPAENGNVLVQAPSGLGNLLAISLSGDALELARRGGVVLRLSHWATCPDKAEWREREAAKRRTREAADG